MQRFAVQKMCAEMGPIAAYRSNELKVESSHLLLKPAGMTDVLRLLQASARSISVYSVHGVTGGLGQAITP